MSSAELVSVAERIRAALRVVIDPELGYNIVDLGLIYDIAVDAAGAARVLMTTTTRGCPATSYLQEGTRHSATQVAGVTSVEVVMTHAPPWSPQKMSSAAKQHFGIHEESTA